MITGASYLLQELQRRGIKRVFGLPGRENAQILFNEADGIEFVTSRIEFNAGIMAEFSGRLSRTPQVVFCTMGPGATNMVTAAAAAMLNHSPLIIISAQSETENRYYNLAHQCVDQRAIFAPVTKLSLELDHVGQLPHAIERAFTEIMTEPLGPVHISIPVDIYSQKLSEALLGAHISPRQSWPRDKADQETLLRLHSMLMLAKRPLCLAGHEVIRAGAVKQVAHLCERWNIPLLSAANSKGILPHEHPLNLGSASPYMEGILQYDRALKDIFENADLILNIGYQYVDDLTPKMWDHGVEKVIVHISALSCQKLSAVYSPQFVVPGHIWETLDRFESFPSEKKHSIGFDSLRARVEDCYSFTSGDGAITPVEVVRTINTHLGNGFLITDIGYYRHHAILFSRPHRTEQFFTDSGLSSFGTGLPSAAAAQFHAPHLPVFLICGDGGFHSGSCDLETLKRFKLPVVIIVLNNNKFELIERYQRKGDLGHNPEVIQFGSVDFVKLAEANGISAARATNVVELNQLIEARDKTEPILIEVPLAYHGEEVFAESF